MTRISIAIIATLIVTTGPALARTDAQKCSAFKWKAAGTHARCLLKEDARALKAGKSPDYSACERKLTLKYTRADRKWACEIEDEVANVRDLLEACADGVRITTASGSSLVGVEPGWVCTGPAPGGCTTICGDGITAGNELCDDGNAIDGDGCSTNCEPETINLAGQWTVDVIGILWTATFAPDGATMIMQNILRTGCESTCIYEAALGNCASNAVRTSCTLDLELLGGSYPTCNETLGLEKLLSSSPDRFTNASGTITLTRLTEPDTTCAPPVFPLAFCGDGDPMAPEVCDDGNNTSGDGCSADCQSNETCGNGITDDAAGEECDDGNTLSEDGCTAACEIERCGDAIEQPNEVCDDGNDVGGDGCSADCLSDETCGNGITDGAAGEQCDGEESCNPDCSSPDDCDLSGQYSSQTFPVPGSFLFEDDQMGSVVFSMFGGPIFPLIYDARLPGARLFGGSSEMQILSCLPVSISLFQGLDVLTRIGPLPEPSASGAFLDGARY